MAFIHQKSEVNVGGFFEIKAYGRSEYIDRNDQASRGMGRCELCYFLAYIRQVDHFGINPEISMWTGKKPYGDCRFIYPLAEEMSIRRGTGKFVFLDESCGRAKACR